MSDLQEYTILPQNAAPPEYPFGPAPDEFSRLCFAPEYAARRQAFFEFIRRNPAPTNHKAIWHELARLEAGGAPHEGIFQASIDYVNARLDCSDVVLHGLLRLLYQYGGHTAVDPALLERASQAIVDFRYYPDEPGSDTMNFWSENHLILFASAGYLAGQLYPERIFSCSGTAGAQKMLDFRGRILTWLNLRFLTGFSEWLSHVYYDEDLVALLSLVDFCEDDEIRRRAAMLVDLLLFEMAAHNFSGVFASSHGRSYEHNKKWAAQESTTDTQKLLFGRGVFAGQDNASAAALALSPVYSLPCVLFDIANDQERPELLHRQRMSINIAQATEWGLRKDDLESGLHFFSLGPSFHPEIAGLTLDMLDIFDWWEHPDFAALHSRRGMLKSLRSLGMLKSTARRFEYDACRGLNEEVNLYTYRTPDYMLSSAQDYRKGYGGYQQHIWQATLGPDAVSFTTHPGRPQGPAPNYWAGSGVLPRVAQIKNVVIAAYRPENFAMLQPAAIEAVTHAWLPRDRFEETIERDGWVFARYGSGYLALLSEHPYEWHDLPGEDQGRELLVRQKNNFWLCEMGRSAVDGPFSSFIERILAAEVLFSGKAVKYTSPTQGRLQFGWNGSLRQEGRDIALNEYPRYASPYVQAPFPPQKIEISLGRHWLHLDWAGCQRDVSDTIS